MKKGFLSIAVLAASLFSFSALAQSQQASPECTTQQCPAKPEACPRNAKACPADQAQHPPRKAQGRVRSCQQITQRPLPAARFNGACKQEAAS